MNVTITTARVTNALVVPVDALLAQPNGSYAVEVAGAHGSPPPGDGLARASSTTPTVWFKSPAPASWPASALSCQTYDHRQQQRRHRANSTTSPTRRSVEADRSSKSTR